MEKHLPQPKDADKEWFRPIDSVLYDLHIKHTEKLVELWSRVHVAPHARLIHALEHSFGDEHSGEHAAELAGCAALHLSPAQEKETSDEVQPARGTWRGARRRGWERVDNWP
jgi:hypothetical protein